MGGHSPLSAPASTAGPASPPAPVGARWVAGLGAFLIVAAAATFVAVRWDEIPDTAKLGLLVAITGTCLAAHQRLRVSLPVTAAALFHLGVLLVPIDVAAVGVRAGWAWPTMLLAQGLTATVVFGVAAAYEQSVVLRGATWLGVVLSAGGLGGATDLPAGLVLAITAAVVVVGPGSIPSAAGGGRIHSALDPAAAGWAALAGLAVPLAGAERLGWPAAGVLRDLGLAGEPPHWTAAATGVAAGVVLGVVAQRRRVVALALLGVACGLVGVTTAFVSFEPTLSASLVALAVLALLAELAAAALRRDPFWARPTGVVAILGEVVAGTLTVGWVGVLLAAPFDVSPTPRAALAAGLVAIGWTAAWLRQPAGPARGAWTWALAAAGLSASAAITLSTGSGAWTAVALTGFGAGVMLGPAVGASATPPSGLVLAAGLMSWAPIAAYDVPGMAAALALLGALATAETAVQLTRRPATWRHVTAARSLALFALVPVGTGGSVVAAHGGRLAAVLGAVVSAWLVAAVLDRAVSPRSLWPALSLTARVGGLVPLAVTPLLAPEEAVVVGLAVAGLAVLDAWRLDQPLLAVGAGCGLPVAVVGLAVASDWTVPEAGVGATLTGVAWLGLSGTLTHRWVRPAVTNAVIAAAGGLVLSAGDATLFATNLLIVGATLAALGIAIGQGPLVAAGLSIATVGLWGHLAINEVAASEPYVLPVAVLLLAVGRYAYVERGLSSWLSFAPGVALLGGAALTERLAGGPGWHALVAGAVGATAVAAGGAWRLAGPLFVGTGLVVAVTVHETLGVTASLPTWAWLAVGGAGLLAAGVAMERRGAGPYETGRRLVDLVRERFA